MAATAAPRSSSFTATSDKGYWHRYLPFYERYFDRLRDENLRVLEFGVFHGDSMRFLAERFPGVELHGADILPRQPEWPDLPNVSYHLVDQAQPDLVRRLLAHLGELDLIIEDGSHEPWHQRNCLVTALPHLRSGGLYILEDLHTSKPAHPLAQVPGTRGYVNCYNVLLALEHLISSGRTLTHQTLAALTERSMFTPEQVVDLFDRVGSVEIHTRSMLPLRCWACGADEFRYDALLCTCGEQLLAPADSTTAVIVTR